MSNKIDFKTVMIQARIAGSNKAKELESVTHWYPCGFASIRFSGRGNFAKYALAEDFAYKAYQGGIAIGSGAFGYRGQSQVIAEEVCKAAKAVFEANGIKVLYVDSRID